MTEMTQTLVADMHTDLCDIHVTCGKQFASNLHAIVPEVFEHR